MLNVILQHVHVHVHTCTCIATYLCDDNVTVGSILIGYHVVKDELWHLCCLTTACVALDDDNLVLLNGRDYPSCLIGNRKLLSLLETLEREIRKRQRVNKR